MKFGIRNDTKSIEGLGLHGHLLLSGARLGLDLITVSVLASKMIGLHSQSMVGGSIDNIIRRRTLYGHLNKIRIFTLIVNENFK